MKKIIIILIILALIGTGGYYYYNKSIDIYNVSDPFYNDVCFSYAENGTDITLKKRRELIYENISFCEDNCYYEGINYTVSKVLCSCYNKTSFDNPIISCIFIGSFIHSLNLIFFCSAKLKLLLSS